MNFSGIRKLLKMYVVFYNNNVTTFLCYIVIVVSR